MAHGVRRSRRSTLTFHLLGWDSTNLWNVDILLRNYTAPYPKNAVVFKTQAARQLLGCVCCEPTWLHETFCRCITECAYRTCKSRFLKPRNMVSSPLKRYLHCLGCFDVGILHYTNTPHKMRNLPYYRNTSCQTSRNQAKTKYTLCGLRFWRNRVRRRVFWDTAPCTLAGVDRRFRRAYCLHVWNVGLLQRDYTALYPRTLSSSKYTLQAISMLSPTLKNNCIQHKFSLPFFK
jgi:hypothetical protein